MRAIYLQGKNSSAINGKSKSNICRTWSVNCILCKQKQQVMKVIAEKYGEQVQIISRRKWQRVFPPQRISTEKENDKLLQGKGIKLITKKG